MTEQSPIPVGITRVRSEVRMLMVPAGRTSADHVAASIRNQVCFDCSQNVAKKCREVDFVGVKTGVLYQPNGEAVTSKNCPLPGTTVFVHPDLVCFPSK